MFKKIYIVILICFIFTCCSKESTLPVEDVNTTFQATIQPEIEVRGEGSETAEVIADKAYLEVWWNDARALRQELDIEPGTTQVNFPVRLASGFDYDVYIWVGNEGYYDTSNLRNVSVSTEKPYDGKTLEFDAFFAYEHVEIIQEDAIHEVTLKRPFAKLTFTATASRAKIAFKAPTTFCLKTGEVSELKDFEYEIEGVDSKVKAFDYVFAREALLQMNYSFQVGEEEIKTTIVPIARNTKTNIIYNTSTN